MSDYYQILGLEKNATESEIKKAYRQKAREYHPDINKAPEAEDKFKEVQRAYSILSDPDKKQQYDLYGTESNQSNIQSEMDEMMKHWSRFYNTGFENRRPSQPVYEIEVAISLKESYLGGNKDISLNIPQKCIACDGTGARGGNTTACQTCGGQGQIRVTNRSRSTIFTQIVTCGDCRGCGYTFEEPCIICHGSGKSNSTQNMTIKIPKGVMSGTALRYNRGDYKLVVYFKVNTQHGDFTREGDHLVCNLEVSLKEAILGAEKHLTLLDDTQINLKIPPDTNYGTLQKLKGKGMPNGYGSCGDLFVKIIFNLPQLNDKQKRRINDLL